MPVEVKISPKAWKQEFFQGLKGAVSSRSRATGTLLGTVITFSLVIFSTRPVYSFQMLSSGLQHWPIAFITRLSGIFMESGYTGLFLTLVFALMVGVTMTNTVIQLRMNRMDLSSLGALPGFLAGGCASCGLGVLSLLGFGGVLASMPFGGNIFRLGGISILAALIVRNGDPDTCKI